MSSRTLLGILAFPSTVPILSPQAAGHAPEVSPVSEPAPPILSSVRQLRLDLGTRIPPRISRRAGDGSEGEFSHNNGHTAGDHVLGNKR